MLSEKPWKPDAILRLMLSVLVCIFIGAVLASVARYFQGVRPENPALFFSAAACALVLLAAALAVLSRPWGIDTFTRQFVILLVCIYAGLSFSWWSLHLLGDGAAAQPSIWKALFAALSFQGAALVLLARFLREHQIRWSEAFGLRTAVPLALLLGVLVALIAVPIGWTLQRVSAEVMMRFQVQPEAQPAVQVLFASETWLDRLILGVAAIVLAPVAEEMLFRGVLYPAIKQAGYPRFALWGTALAFAAMHLNVMIFLPLTLLALALTWLYERTNNLLAPILAHSLFNGVNFLLFIIERLGARSGP
jgi:uncharacterized protein